MELQVSFRDQAHLQIQLRSRILIIAGPNGAGKSRMLKDIDMINWAGPTPDNNITRSHLDGAYLAPMMLDVTKLASISLTLQNHQPYQQSTLDLDYSVVSNYLSTQPARRAENPAHARLAEFVTEDEIARFHEANRLDRHRLVVSLLLKASSSGLTHLSKKFSEYHANFSAMKYAGQDIEAIENILGRRPWLSVNEKFRDFGLPYEIRAPDIETVLPGAYPFGLHRLEDDQYVDAAAFSSGEKVVLALFDVMEIYTQHPRLLLIDDLDGFLHPPLLKKFCTVLQAQLEEKGWLAVISTHSPLTAQIFAQADFYYKESFAAALIPASREEIVGRLSANEFVIVDSMKLIFVEGQDHAFYNSVYHRMMRKNVVRPSRSIRFISPRHNRQNDGAGHSAVTETVRILRQNGFGDSFFGLIDRDRNNRGEDGVDVLSRYSIENYWMDPLNVYAWFVDEQYADIPQELCFTEVLEGESYSIFATTTHDQRQLIVDVISDLSRTLVRAQNLLPGVDLNITEPIEIHGGGRLNYPSFLISSRGKTVIPTIEAIHARLNRSELSQKFCRGMFWPNDLVILMRRFAEDGR